VLDPLGQQLQRDVALEVDVFDAKDLAHLARADQGEQLQVLQRLTDEIVLRARQNLDLDGAAIGTGL